MDWMKLKSGSDVRGVAMGENRVLTEEVARALGMAFAHMVAERSGKPVNEVSIAIGRDSRITGPQLLSAAADGIVRACAPRLPCIWRLSRLRMSRTAPSWSRRHICRRSATA